MFRNSSIVLRLVCLLFVMWPALNSPSFLSAADDGVRVQIPTIDVNAVITPIELRVFPDGNVTWDTSQLRWDVGYFEGTAWFGEGSNIVLGGHSELEGRRPAVFYELDAVEVGDEIIITERNDRRQYTVTRVFEVDVDNLDVVMPTSSERLTLITCDTDSLNDGRYSRRVVVIAQPIGSISR
jgi:LPXTG-site transpeptidase (sortase) family protein